MSKYKIHYGQDGAVKGCGPNVDEYQPYLEVGGTIVITDTLPPPSGTEFFERLRMATEQRLAATDKYATVDYPDSELRKKMLLYRAELRAINRQTGAPWDGGGEQTPWPEPPTV